MIEAAAQLDKSSNLSAFESSCQHVQYKIEKIHDVAPVPVSTKSKLSYVAVEGVAPLDAGHQLSTFGGLFSEEELKKARKVVAQENIDVSGQTSPADYRLKAGLSQAELAKKISKTQANLSLYERGKSEPGIFTAKQISNILGISLDDYYDALVTAKG